jgi:hypothetical protein
MSQMDKTTWIPDQILTRLINCWFKFFLNISFQLLLTYVAILCLKNSEGSEMYYIHHNYVRRADVWNDYSEIKDFHSYNKLTMYYSY